MNRFGLGLAILLMIVSSAPAGLAAVACVILAAVAAIRDGERGGVVFITLIVGLAIAFVVIAEFLPLPE
jgi:hypothetical protein